MDRELGAMVREYSFPLPSGRGRAGPHESEVGDSPAGADIANPVPKVTGERRANCVRSWICSVMVIQKRGLFGPED